MLSLNRALLLKEINKVKNWPQPFSPLNLINMICVYWMQVKESLSNLLTHTCTCITYNMENTWWGMDSGKSNKPQSALSLNLVSTESKLSDHWLSLSLWHTWVTSRSRNITGIRVVPGLDVRGFLQTALDCLELMGPCCVRTFYCGPRGSPGVFGVD